MSVLTEILERAARTPGAVGVFDLDSTLFSTQQRNHSILKEFVAIAGAPSDLAKVISALAPGDMGWNVIDDLRRKMERLDDVFPRLSGIDHDDPDTDKPSEGNTDGNTQRRRLAGIRARRRLKSQ